MKQEYSLNATYPKAATPPNGPKMLKCTNLQTNAILQRIHEEKEAFDSNF